MVLSCNRQSITPCTMPPKRVPVWEHFLAVDGEDKSTNPTITCTFCDQTFEGNATRCKAHLTGGKRVSACSDVLEDVKHSLLA
jgi:BED zinc finger